MHRSPARQPSGWRAAVNPPRAAPDRAGANSLLELWQSAVTDQPLARLVFYTDQSPQLAPEDLHNLQAGCAHCDPTIIEIDDQAGHPIFQRWYFRE